MSSKFYLSFTLLTGLLYYTPVAAQSYINLEAGQVFSTFKYIDSKGVEDNAYSYNVVSAYSIGYQYAVENGLFARASIGMRKAGANLVYNDINYIWNMQYTDVKAGIGYRFTKWRLKPSISISPYYAHLLDASQSINDDNYDIKDNKSIKNSDYGLFISPGLNIILSSYVSIYAEYNYILGLQNIETATEEKLYNRGFSLNFGVSLNITKIAKLNQPRIVK
ncbi:MAG: hypothetical protein Q7W13_01915 [Bacteroidia bacterium]|nr:hypothetical protein [Bacteroidia bacterium]